MSKTHWRRILTTEYLGGFDLDDGKGGHKDVTLTITKAVREEVRSTDGDKTTELVIYFREQKKPMILNVTNAKMLEKLTKSSYIEDWVGTTIIVGTERVKAFGEWHDALRIRPRLGQKTTVTNCAVCGKPITAHKGADPDMIVQKSTEELGEPTCIPCWNAKKAGAEVDRPSTETDEVTP